jgi:hypothetical protein
MRRGRRVEKENVRGRAERANVRSPFFWGNHYLKIKMKGLDPGGRETVEAGIAFVEAR